MKNSRWMTVILNTILLAAGFGTMHMLERFKDAVIIHYGISGSALSYQQDAYVVGLFVAFLLGGTNLFKGSFKRSVALIVSFAAVPQFIIPFVGNWWVVVALRFFQGFIVALIAVFSNQIARLFLAERPFAKGIILSGIFWGGLYGVHLAGWLAPNSSDWAAIQRVFIISAVIMYLMLAVWWFLVEDFEIPKSTSRTSSVSVWRMPFTWVFGFTFFPALWIIFTIGSFTVKHAPFSGAQISTLLTSLEVSLGVWSIIMGYLGYRLSVKNSSNRGLFKAIVSVMSISYAVTFLGLLLVWKGFSSGDYSALLLGLAVTGIVQGTGPAFWTTAPAAYSKEVYPDASFALGLISNSANAVAPNIMFLLVSGVGTGMAIFLAVTLIGIGLLLAASRMRLPVEELGNEA